MKVPMIFSHYTKLDHLYEYVSKRSVYQSYVFELVFHSKEIFFLKYKRIAYTTKNVSGIQIC